MRKLFYLLFLFSSNHVIGQWSTDSLTNNPICVATANQTNPQTVTNGASGATIVWQDTRNGNIDVYMQSISSSGEIQWLLDGVAVCTASGSQSNVQIINAGEGNYLVTWQDSRNNTTTSDDIYAQLISSDGTPQWTADGVVVCDAPGKQITPEITSDGNGGAFIVWQDARSGTADIYAQHIDASGNTLWIANGVAICTAANPQMTPRLISDNNKGAIIVWRDIRTGISDIYAQRINSDGTFAWATDGILICGASGDQYEPRLATDGSGGAVIAWYDVRSSTDIDIYVNRVSEDGTLQWTTDGNAIVVAANDQVNHQIITDGNGGAFIVWEDARSGINIDGDPYFDTDIYTQKINNIGVVEWVVNGIPVSLETGDQITPRLMSDGNNGIIITWSDARFGAANDIYAQRMNSAGDAQWTSNGTAVSSADGNQFVPQLVASNGGAIVAWQDARVSPTDINIYASRLSALGTLPVTALSFYGKQTDFGNVLYWTTATEQNNFGFNVERSGDGIQFNSICFREGSGNSSTQQSYSFTDKQPLNSKNYYRLKQMDRDGKFTYSPIILLQFFNKSATVNVYPNPTKNRLNISVQVNNAGKIQWQLMNNKGQPVKQGSWQLAQGSNALPYIDISNLAEGVYYLKLNGSSGQQVIKLVKQ